MDIGQLVAFQDESEEEGGYGFGGEGARSLTTSVASPGTAGSPPLSPSPSSISNPVAVARVGVDGGVGSKFGGEEEWEKKLR